MIVIPICKHEIERIEIFGGRLSWYFLQFAHHVLEGLIFRSFQIESRKTIIFWPRISCISKCAHTQTRNRTSGRTSYTNSQPISTTNKYR